MAPRQAPVTDYLYIIKQTIYFINYYYCCIQLLRLVRGLRVSLAVNTVINFISIFVQHSIFVCRRHHSLSADSLESSIFNGVVISQPLYDYYPKCCCCWFLLAFALITLLYHLKDSVNINYAQIKSPFVFTTNAFLFCFNY